MDITRRRSIQGLSTFIRTTLPGSPRHRLLLRRSILLALGLPGLAMATDPPPASSTSAPPPVTDMTGVAVDATSYDARRDDTATRIVVTQTELQRFGDTTLSDTLKRLPGVTVATGVPGKAGAISLRGMGNGYTQILLNGQKAPLGFDLESLTPDMIERVEILRSVTADVRTESIAGTINIVLKKAASKRNASVKLSTAMSRGRITPGVTWQMSDQRGDMSYGLNAAVARRNYLVTEHGIQTGSDADGTPNLLRYDGLRVRGRNDTLSMAPSFNLKLHNGDKVSVETFIDASHLIRTGDITSDTVVGDVLAHPTDHQRTDNRAIQGRADISWSHEFATAGHLDTKLTLNADHTHGDFREQGYDVDNVLNLNTVTRSTVRGRGFNSTGKYTLPYVDSHMLELGWDGGINRRDETRVQTGLNVPGVDPENSDLSFRAKVGRLGLYAQDEWTITPMWSLYYGLRLENLSTTSSGRDFGRVSNHEKVLSPLVQSLWKIPGMKKDQVRLAFSRTYNAPPIASLIPRPYTSTNNTPLNPDTVGNPALRPELAVGVDLAFEHYWQDDAMVSIGTYGRRIKNIIRQEVNLVDGRWVMSPFNGGDATAWGIEMDSKFTLDQLIGGAPPLNVRFNVTRNWSNVDDVPGANNRINDQTRLSSSLSVDYRFSPAWSGGASYTFKTGGPVRSAIHQIDSSAARRVLDLYALWNMSKATSLRLSLANLLRQDFVKGTEYFDANGDMRDVTRRPSQATIRADLEMKY